LREEVVEVLCLLEREFPPTIFNISMHLLIHIENELEHCGLVRTRWMYPIERYMKVLKKIVRTREKPEGSMSEGYSMQEAMGFCTEYMKDFKNVNRRVWDDDEDERVVGEVLEGNGRCFKLSNKERSVIHAYVLQNTSSFDKWHRVKKIYTIIYFFNCIYTFILLILLSCTFIFYVGNMKKRIKHGCNIDLKSADVMI
jgi:hypothetical protein